MPSSVAKIQAETKQVQTTLNYYRKNMKLKFKKLSTSALSPQRTNLKDAGLDLFAAEYVDIHPGDTKVVKTDIAVQLETDDNKDYGLFLWDRSGMGSKGIHRYAGVIDQNYTGNIGCVLHNSTKELKQIRTGDKIIQLIIQEVFCPELVEVDDLDETVRGDKGFGSSDELEIGISDNPGLKEFNKIPDKGFKANDDRLITPKTEEGDQGKDHVSTN